MKFYLIDGNRRNYYHGMVLNENESYQIEFVDNSEFTSEECKYIGDFVVLLREDRLNPQCPLCSCTFSQKAFHILKDFLMPEEADYVKTLNFEGKRFYIVVPKVFGYNSQECISGGYNDIPEQIHFFRRSPYSLAEVTETFKDATEKHGLKGFCFQLEYDSEAV